MVNKYMKARKLSKLLKLLEEFDLDPRDLKRELDNLQNKLNETKNNLDYMCKKVDAIEKRAEELEKAPSVDNNDEGGLTYFEMYEEMMTGIPTKGTN